MDLTSKNTIKELLEKQGARPSKGLGQNFLIDKNILEKIVNSADINNEDVILEVGPGIGNLTTELAKLAKKVFSIEKDNTMLNILSETLKDFKNVEVLNKDILKFNIEDIKTKKYKVVANIPYYLTSPLIRKFLEEKNQPKEIVLMIQKEVAQRICSKAPDMNLLAASVQFYADPKIISYVSKNSFWPSPKIDSAIIKIIPNKKWDIDSNLFFKVAKAGFSHPRKQLINNFSNSLKLKRGDVELWLKRCGILPNQRAETLNISDWVNLTKTYEF